MFVASVSLAEAVRAGLSGMRLLDEEVEMLGGPDQLHSWGSKAACGCYASG